MSEEGLSWRLAVLHFDDRFVSQIGRAIRSPSHAFLQTASVFALGFQACPSILGCFEIVSAGLVQTKSVEQAHPS